MSKPTTWKACQEELEDAQRRIATLTAERDNLKRQLQTAVESCLTLTYARDEMEKERDAAQSQHRALTHSYLDLCKERDALREDLRVLAKSSMQLYSHYHDICLEVEDYEEIKVCLDRPGVQEVLKTQLGG